MSQSEKNRLFKKYLDGVISKEEKHTLDEYALDDDFIFDALEGSAELQGDFSRSMFELEKRIDSKTKKSKKPVLLWFTVAASIAVIVVALMWMPTPGNEVMSDVVPEQFEIEARDAGDKGILETITIETEDGASTSAVVDTKIKATKDDVVGNATVIQTENEFKRIPAQGVPEVVSTPKPIAPEATESKSAIANSKVSEQSVIPPQPSAVSPEEVVGEEYFDIIADKVDQEKEEVTEEVAADEGLSRKESKRYANESSRISLNKSFRKKLPETLLSESEADAFLTNDLVVEVQNEPEMTSKLQTYISRESLTERFDGEFRATLTLKNGKRKGNIEIQESVSSDWDRRLKLMLEKYEDWIGTGNKIVIIRFTKE